MPEYRRVFQKGGVYFLTLVTYKRQDIFSSFEARKILHAAIDHVQKYHPFTILAYCVVPNHIHFLWELPENDADYSMRISQIKRRFSIRYSEKIIDPIPKSTSQKKRRELTIWQRRFYEHFIRDEEDLNRHIDYIHYNPVHHGYVASVCDWADSSFYDYVNQGYYDLLWGNEYDIDEKRYQFGE
jgi:putative transposase